MSSIKPLHRCKRRSVLPDPPPGRKKGKLYLALMRAPVAPLCLHPNPLIFAATAEPMNLPPNATTMTQTTHPQMMPELRRVRSVRRPEVALSVQWGYPSVDRKPKPPETIEKETHK